MRKLSLTLGLAGMVLLTACKKEEAKTTDTSAAPVESTASTPAAKESTAAPTTVNGVEVPKFSIPEMQQFANDYAAYVSETMAASKSGDAAKIQELNAKAQEWATKQSSLAGKMTPDDAKLWSEFAMKLVQAQQPK